VVNGNQIVILSIYSVQYCSVHSTCWSQRCGPCSDTRAAGIPKLWRTHWAGFLLMPKWTFLCP